MAVKRGKGPQYKGFAGAMGAGAKKLADFFISPVAKGKALRHIAPVAATNGGTRSRLYPGIVVMSGCSSGVEHNLAKVGVERSNRFTRSIFSPDLDAELPLAGSFSPLMHGSRLDAHANAICKLAVGFPDDLRYTQISPTEPRDLAEPLPA